METNISPLGLDDTQRFLSIADLRIAHNDLLKSYRELDNKSEMTREIESFMHKGQATGELLSSEDDRWAVQSLLDYWASILFRAGYGNIDPKLEEYNSSLAPELDDSLCPYLGLESFNEQKRNLFFGRQQLVEALIDKLKTNRLLAVIGSSGTGKSSVVLAGLLPRLKAGALPESETWHYYDRILPGSNPLKTLAQIICPNDTNPNVWIPQAVEQFSQDSSYLTQIIDSNGVPSVLVVDQFEEVFTLCQNKATQQAFADNLLGLINASSYSHMVILMMRADFESQVVMLPEEFQQFYEEAKVQITYLGASELREAIEKPAELIGLKFEKGLVTALVKDVLVERAALPLLQFILLKLWNSRDRNRITWQAYKELSGGKEVGGAREALQQTAEDFYNNLAVEDRTAVKRILLRMVRPREGLDFTSNRVQVSSLYRSGEDNTLIKRVLDNLIDKDLVRLTKGATTEDDLVEVAHEALVRNWQRLVDWLNKERKAIREHLHLTEATEQWAKNKETDLLWRGNQLEKALQYEDLNTIETEFVRYSQQVQKEEIDRQKNQQEKENRFQKKVTYGAVLVTLVTICFAFIAMYYAVQAKKSEEKVKKESKFILVDAKNILKRVNLLEKVMNATATKTNIQLEYSQSELRKLNYDIKNGGLTQDIVEKKLTQIIGQFDNYQENQSIKTASKNETEGFNALLEGDIEKSKEYFGKVNKAYPEYNNVGAIYHQVLSQETLDDYKKPTDLSLKGEKLRSIFTNITEQYSNGAPSNKIDQMRDRLKTTIQRGDADREIVMDIQRFGFRIDKIDPIISNSTINSIYFGSKVNINNVKLVAEILFKHQINIKSIRPLLEEPRESVNLIQIVADPEVQSCPNWSLDFIQNTSTIFTRANNGCFFVFN